MNSLCEILPSLLVSTVFNTLRNLSSSLPSRTPLWFTSRDSTYPTHGLPRDAHRSEGP
jgi:hypothetical protein